MATFTNYEQSHQAAKDRLVELLSEDPSSAHLQVARRQVADRAGAASWEALVADCRRRYVGPVAGDPPLTQLEVLHRLQTDTQHHSAGTLFDHLLATRELLAEWGNDADVCAAGLFHSIYGTEYFRVQSESLANRHHVAAAIGERSERLAYLFCVTDRLGFASAARASTPTLRNHLDGSPISIDADEGPALVEIEVANIVEQVHPKFSGPAARSRIETLVRDADGLVSHGALRSLTDLAGRLAQRL